MKTYSVRNMSNRPIELIFGEGSERVAPRTTSNPHNEKEWNGSIAKQQAEEFVKRREVRIIVNDNESKSTQISQPSSDGKPITTTTDATNNNQSATDNKGQEGKTKSNNKKEGK